MFIFLLTCICNLSFLCFERVTGSQLNPLSVQLFIFMHLSGQASSSAAQMLLPSPLMHRCLNRSVRICVWLIPGSLCLWSFVPFVF